MTYKKIQEAIKEVERFLDKAKKAQARILEDREPYHSFSINNSYTTSPETAACRRASMDLTRALAQLRKV